MGPRLAEGATVIGSGSPPFRPSRPGSGFVLVVLRHDCGATTAHVFQDSEELTELEEAGLGRRKGPSEIASNLRTGATT